MVTLTVILLENNFCPGKVINASEVRGLTFTIVDCIVFLPHIIIIIIFHHLASPLSSPHCVPPCPTSHVIHERPLAPVAHYGPPRVSTLKQILVTVWILQSEGELCVVVAKPC